MIPVQIVRYVLTVVSSSLDLTTEVPARVQKTFPGGGRLCSVSKQDHVVSAFPSLMCENYSQLLEIETLLEIGSRRTGASQFARRS